MSQYQPKPRPKSKLLQLNKITTPFLHKDISNAVPDVYFNIIFDHLIRKVIIYWNIS